MTTCPACAEQIPKDVATCPHCGISIYEYAPGEGRKAGGSKTSMFLIVGLIIAGLLGFLVVCGGIPAALIMPAMQQAREAARRTQCMNNLRQIGLALHNYHDQYGTLPPAIVADKDGKPMHSWRVLILPHLGEQSLYKDYDFSEPWDGPNNSRLLTRMPTVYACPSNPTTGTNTAYAGVFGEHCVFRAAGPIGISAITDGTSNTLMVGEVARANIPWMKPEDIDIRIQPALGVTDGFSSFHVRGVPFVMCDGSVHVLNQSLPQQTVDALYTRDGHEVVGDF